MIVLFAVLFHFSTAMALDISLSFDDAPMESSQIYSGIERTQKIIKVLEKHQIKTVFYVNSFRLSVDNGLLRLKKYADAGHLIANHTHTHLRLTTNPEEFIEEIKLTDPKIKEFKTYTKLFRFPYLHEGDDASSRDTVRVFLKSSGYRNGYVTVDNYDYFINDLVQRALLSGKKVNLEKACEMLTDLMVDGINYYDQVAQKTLGNVSHVLLMHENDIEAYCLEKLIARIKREGWNIVSPSKSYEDPILSREPDTLYLGQGRVAALSNEKTGIKYRSKWESTDALTKEFNRRKIVE